MLLKMIKDYFKKKFDWDEKQLKGDGFNRILV